MASLLNGVFSDGNTNKCGLENVYNCSSLGDTLKFKARKISAVRDFPPGCGPGTQQINSEPQQIVNVAADERGKLGSFEAVRNSLRGNMVVPHSDSLCASMEGNQKIEVVSLSNTEIEAKDPKKPPHLEHQEVLDAPVTNDILLVEKADDTKTFANPEIQSDEVHGNPVEMEDDILLDDLVGRVDTKTSAEPGIESDEVCGTPSEVEDMLLNDVVGRVVSVVMDGMDGKFEEKVLDVRPVDMKFPLDQERSSIELSEESNGNETLNLLKQLDNEDSLARINHVPEDVMPTSETGVLVDRKDCLKHEAFPCPKDTFPRRRVSAIREFPPYCGRNCPPLVKGEQLRMGGGDKSVSRIENSGVTAVDRETQVNIEGGDAVNKHVDNEPSVGKEIVIYEPAGPIAKKPSNDASTSGRCKEPAMVNALNAIPHSSWRQWEVASCSEDVNTGGSTNKQIAGWQNKYKTVAKKSTPKAGSLVRHSLKRDYVSICEDDGTPGLPAIRGEEECEDLNPGCTLDIDITLPTYDSNSCPGDARTKVRETLQLFQTICRKLLQVEGAKPKPDVRRIDLEAVKVMKSKGIDAGGKKYLGAVPGVEVGDEFQYRVELAIVGVHRLYQAGIDYMKDNKMVVAISIVSSGAYANDREDEDSLIYCGQGGNAVGKDKKPEDQKLERGNLALKNSITTKNPVRVIHGFKETKSSDLADSKSKIVTIYVYDGLYTVESYWQEEGKYGNQVYMFKLKRIPGQPELNRKQVKMSNKLKMLQSNLC